MDAITSGLTNLGIGGLVVAALIAIHWHLISVVIPKMMETFKEELAAERDHCKEELKAEREAHEKHVNTLASRLDRIEDRLPRPK